MTNGKRSQLVEQRQAEPRAPIAEFQPADFRDLRERHRAADGMAEERARMNRLAARLRPGEVHHVRAPHARRERETTGQGFAQADQVRHDAAVFARKPFSGAAKAGVNLVQDQQRALLVAQAAQQRQKLWRRNAAAGAALNRFDEDGADFLAAEQRAEAGFDQPEGRVTRVPLLTPTRKLRDS